MDGVKSLDVLPGSGERNDQKVDAGTGEALPGPWAAEPWSERAYNR